MSKRLREYVVIGSFAAVTALVGCGGSTFAMTPDPSVPFAEGKVSVASGDAGNSSFTVNVEHLGDPKKLSASATVYVVWLQPKKDDSPIQNVGSIKVDDAQAGTHTFSSSFKEFDSTITPEETAEVTKPSNRDVLKVTVDID